VRRVWRQRNEGSGQGPCAQLIAPCRPCTRAPGNTSKYSRLKGHRAAGPARPSPDGDGQPRDRIAVAVAVAVAGARRPLLCTGSGQRAACRSTRDPARRRPSLFCSVPSHRLLSAHRQTQIMCCSHSSAQEASAPPASAPHRQRPHGLRCGRRTGAERSPNRQTGMGPQLQLSSSAGPGAVLEPCWSWVSLDAEARGQLQRDGDATGRRTTTGVAERASRRQARSGCPPALRARELAAAHGASARAPCLSRVVFVSVTALLGPGLVRALQPSRRVGASPDAPRGASGLLTLATWKTKALSPVRLLSCHQPGSKEPHGIPPSSRGRSKTHRRGTFTVNVMAACLIIESLSLPGRRKRQSSTLLVQAVPHASRLRRMASGQGLAALRAFTPGAALLSAAPCLSGSLNRT
jgi:hypothetical protein